MIFTEQKILVLTDGSQGMISQVYGLAKKFSSNIISMQTNLLFPWSKLQPGILPLFSWIFLNDTTLNYPPNIIISCGRKSVYLSIFLKKKYKDAITIHIQDPKINYNYFDYVVAPNHDNITGNNILTTTGALHKFDKNIFLQISETSFDIPIINLISVIIGGSNNHYNFSLKEINQLILEIKKIKREQPKYNFLILFSRRTTQKMKDMLKNKLKDIAIVWEKNENNPYTFSLKYSKYFIVTSDSTSMISECAYSGKPIYIFHLPFKRKSKRIEKFHNQFQKLNITKKLNSKNDLITWTYEHLNESERIASIIKKKIIKQIHESK